MPIIPSLKREMQEDLCEFKACLVYKASSKIPRASQKNPVSKINKLEGFTASASQVLESKAEAGRYSREREKKRTKKHVPGQLRLYSKTTF